MGTHNKNDKNILVYTGITIYFHRTNMRLIKYFDNKNKDIPNSIEESKKIYKEFTDNDKL